MLNDLEKIKQILSIIILILIKNFISNFNLLFQLENSFRYQNNLVKTSISLIILMIYVFHLNLNTRYSVSLVLTKSGNEIDSLEQLALREDVTPIMIGGSSFEEYFKVYK